MDGDDDPDLIFCGARRITPRGSPRSGVDGQKYRLNDTAHLTLTSPTALGAPIPGITAFRRSNTQT